MSLLPFTMVLYLQGQTALSRWPFKITSRHIFT